MDERPPEICGAVAVESAAGAATAQRWWSHQAQAELLRFGRRTVEEAPTPAELVSESDLIGLLDAAWGDGLLSDFAKRQLFHLMMRRYEEDPEGLWASGGPSAL
ncbi:MAG: hypothetical protein O2888_00825 [Chloroflexi bacterium]|nr:hypothetical protein [Chloroflexota bacterium]